MVVMNMLPAATSEALSTCARIDQWLDGQRALARALRETIVARETSSGMSLRGDDLNATVRPVSGAR